MATLLQLIASRLDKLKSIVYSLYPVRLCFGLINTDITSIHSKHRTKAGRVDKNCALKANPCFCLIVFCFTPYLLLLSHIRTTIVFESELILKLRFVRYKKAIPFTVMLNKIRLLKEKMGLFYSNKKIPIQVNILPSVGWTHVFWLSSLPKSYLILGTAWYPRRNCRSGSALKRNKTSLNNNHWWIIWEQVDWSAIFYLTSCL